MDAMVTALIAKHDLAARRAAIRVTGSVYVVKPKMHGPDEVAFADGTFAFVEEVLGLPQNTVKLGIMDEERRTSVNLKQCIRAAKNRVAFINTGFLDRTGRRDPHLDGGGAVQPQGFHQAQGLDRRVREPQRRYRAGMRAVGQGTDRQGHVGHARPDGGDAGAEDRASEGRSELRLGAVAHRRDAACAALPQGRRLRGAGEVAQGRAACACGHDLLDIPLATFRKWSEEQVLREVENNAQGILGYVVRWVDQGVGCSKVPDINDVGLMEDRATCRISSQHIANWLHHGVVSEGGDGSHAQDGGGRGPSERGGSGVSTHGAGLRRDRVSGSLRSGVQGAGAACRAIPSRCCMRAGCS